jgi:carboxymethylenebutenolidase
MCDERTVRDASDYLNRARLTRREFGKLSAGAGLAMLLPRAANAQAIAESTVMVTTPDGVADCHFVHPTSGASPAVLVWPDILGLRPAFEQMGRRLAESGYAVLTVNPFYRNARAPVVPEGASFEDEATRNTVFPLAQSLSPETHVTDARAFIAWLDQQDAVDTSRPVGTTGYCMGGPITMRTAATAPDRVGAAASFHGGGLVTDGPDSPHLLVPQMRAGYLFAIAENDDRDDPEAKNVLRNAFDQAGLNAEITVFTAQHGWCPPDSAVYDEEDAERAWARLLFLFGRDLA